MSPRKPVSPENRKGYSGKKIAVFFEKVRAKRMEQNMTQGDLAQILGIPQQRISEMEAGQFPTDPERIIALAKALGVSLDWLFGIES